MFEYRNELMSRLGSLCRESNYTITKPEDFDTDKLFTHTVNLLNCLNPIENPALDVFSDFYEIISNEAKVKRLLSKEKYFEVFKSAATREKKYKLLAKADSNDVVYVSNIYNLNKFDIFYHGTGLDKDGNTCHKFVYDHHKLYVEKGAEIYLDTKKMTIHSIRGNDLCKVGWEDDSFYTDDDETNYEIYYPKNFNGFVVFSANYLSSLKKKEEPNMNKATAFFYCAAPSKKTSLCYCNIALASNISGEVKEYLLTLGAATLLSYDKAKREGLISE